MESLVTSIAVGCQVEVNLIDRKGAKEHLSVDIVPDEQADYAQGFLGVGTPLAKVLLGEKAGTIIPYLKDDIYAIEILSVATSTRKPETEAARKRQEQLEKTIRQVEHSTAVTFASSFSGKWGDYDPDSLPKDDPPERQKDHE